MGDEISGTNGPAGPSLPNFADELLSDANVVVLLGMLLSPSDEESASKGRFCWMSAGAGRPRRVPFSGRQPKNSSHEGANTRAGYARLRP